MSIPNNSLTRGEVLEMMDLQKYKKQVEEYQDNKFVLMVPTLSGQFRGEGWLKEWFAKYHEKMGFDEIVKEKSKEYEALREMLGFKLYPDYLVKRNGKWLRLEIERFSSGYLRHCPDYADVVFCYYKDCEIANTEVISLNELLGYEHIIGMYQIYDFLYLYNESFKKDYDNTVPLDLAVEREIDWR